MKALSIRQPHIHAILHLGKRLENRSRRDGHMPDPCRYRGELWLHASKGMTQKFYRESAHAMQDIDIVQRYPGEPGKLAIPYADELPRGCIVGRCQVVAHLDPEGAVHHDTPRGRKASDGRMTKQSLDLRWWGCDYAMILANVERLAEPVPAKGSRGIWQIPNDVTAQLEGAELIPCATRRATK